jgi:hypothetical protein
LSTNILRKLSNSDLELSKYLKDNCNLTYSEINNFICLDYIENSNNFYSYYLSKLEKNKIADSYSLLFKDEIIRYDSVNDEIYLKLLSNHIVKPQNNCRYTFYKILNI